MLREGELGNKSSAAGRVAEKIKSKKRDFGTINLNWS